MTAAWEEYQPHLRAMTPEDVLAYFAESHGQQCQYDSAAFPDVQLSFDTSVAEWREACDFVDWRNLGRALNTRLATHFSDRQWRGALTPASKRTLGDVCALIATEATIPAVESVPVLGRGCRTAGAFLTIRWLLAQCRVDVSRLRPSSALADYVRTCGVEFVDRLAQVAPGRIPLIKVETPLHDLSTNVLLLSWFFLLAMLLIEQLGVESAVFGVLLGVLAVIGSYVANFVTASLPPARVQLGSLQTFRDLSRAVAGDSRA